MFGGVNLEEENAESCPSRSRPPPFPSPLRSRPRSVAPEFHRRSTNLELKTYELLIQTHTRSNFEQQVQTHTRSNFEQQVQTHKRSNFEQQVQTHTRSNYDRVPTQDRSMFDYGRHLKTFDPGPTYVRSFSGRDVRGQTQERCSKFMLRLLLECDDPFSKLS